jgi:hypothetical protein
MHTKVRPGMRNVSGKAVLKNLGILSPWEKVNLLSRSNLLATCTTTLAKVIPIVKVNDKPFQRNDVHEVGFPQSMTETKCYIGQHLPYRI